MGLGACKKRLPAVNMEEMAEKERLRKEVAQLRREAALERMKVSQCCEDLREYVLQNAANDPLLKGVPDDKNPYKEIKGGCVIS
ncbi:guanine nucleotide-binding protein G(T) subunit gamma-T1-like [Myotis lucifugus]|uniref:guanine nucleotide-binding protein G(T) subunit gamma-T1-like n=1 Tax=Myotis lucifugus TaxID=59463 RepID=UPI000CCC3B44|nr:guanine nucleotide-binding protein G(T) subunit gamma-T1-like [Myotis lucifugus]